MNLNSEIDKELITFSGQTFSSAIDTHRWLKGALTRIAEKTVEAVRVEKKPNIMETESEDKIYWMKRRRGFNQAVEQQDERASAWLGKEN